MKKIVPYLLIAAVIFIGYTMYVSISEIDFNNLSNDSIYTKKTDIKKIELDKYEFENVAYFKNKNKTRYFTFYIKNRSNIDRNNLPKQLLKDAEKLGKNQMNTEGQLTVTFIYLTKEDTPQITNALNATIANEKAHNYKPVIAVWNFGNGTINVIQNPE